MYVHTRPDIKQAVQPLRMVRGLEFRIKDVEDCTTCIDLCSENKPNCADKLGGYRAADLRRMQKADFLGPRDAAHFVER